MVLVPLSCHWFRAAHSRRLVVAVSCFTATRTPSISAIPSAPFFWMKIEKLLAFFVFL
jgi:hypothetical protein